MSAVPTDTVVPGGRREHRKRVTRQELLAAGRRLFGEQGLYDARIEDLTRHAGIAKGTLYGYFGNKDQVIQAVVASGFDALLAEVRRAAAGARSRREVFARVATAHLEFFEANPDLMRIFHQVRGLLKFRRSEGRLLRRVFENYLATLARVLAPRATVMATNRREGMETAMLLFGAVSGISSTRASLARPVTGAARASDTVRALASMARAFESGDETPAPAAGPRVVRSRPRRSTTPRDTIGARAERRRTPDREG